MKTEEEVRELKANWQADPIWDIEDTEGFEEHREELLTFRWKCEAGWIRSATYQKERSTNFLVDQALLNINEGDSIGDSDEISCRQAALYYQTAIGQALLAVVAELRRLNDNLEGK